MKNLKYSILFCIISSCNSYSSDSYVWTEEEKDNLFKECVKISIEIEKLNIDKANEYCYCSLDYITNNFKNLNEVQEKLNLNPDFRDQWNSGCLN